jgi:non-homologous end joining protein Ku
MTHAAATDAFSRRPLSLTFQPFNASNLKVAISKDMVSLASHILESKAAKFDPGKFKDEYEMALRKLVQR